MHSTDLEIFISEKLKNELPKHLYYHSIHHVEDVLKAATIISDGEGISSEDFQLLKIAVLFHDSGFIEGAQDHELRGCIIARKNLPNFDFNENEIEVICGMIMATKIPQSPKNHLEEIICDSDLDYLGRDDYDAISNNLFREINLYNFMDEIGWLKVQINFMEAHSYFTKTANRLRKDEKEKRLQLLKAKLQQLEAQ